MKTLISLVCFAALILLSESTSNLLLIGGALEEDNEAILAKFINLAGGEGIANIGCITTASEDPLGSGEYYEELFLRYGAASATWIPVTETSYNANYVEVIEMIEKQTGFFFGGGDQVRIANAWLEANGSDTQGLLAIRNMYETGAVVGGTSAGSACQPYRPIIAGGLSWNGLKDGAVLQTYNETNPDPLIYSPYGIGFLMEHIVDSHFSERGREGRLIQLLLDSRVNYGLGIDENTAVLITETGQAEVIGTTGGVMLVNVSTSFLQHDKPTAVQNVQISFFTEGDIFNIYTGVSSIPSWKIDLTGGEVNDVQGSTNIFSSPYADPFEQAVFRSFASMFWNSTLEQVVNYSHEEIPRFQVTMRKEDGTSYLGNSPSDGGPRLSYVNMRVDIDYQ